MPTPKQPVPATTANQEVKSAMLFSPPVLKWVIVLLPLAYLWFRLIDNLRLEWTTNPQYGYGLLVPFLCLGLLIRRWHAFPQNRNQKVENRNQFQLSSAREMASPISQAAFSFQRLKSPWSRGLVVIFFSLLAFLYLPTRLIEAATPEWRPIQWLLGIEAIGLTLCAIDLGKGRGWLRQLAFPILFFFVAIPWPTLIEQPIIQALTRASAAVVIELLGWFGVPAMAHGNVIEVATGMVGIDEACSGIRSFQSSIMISLFFGEFYALSRSRRWLLVPAGFVFSMAFNVCRMALLTLIAAKKGVPAISEYHDPAGFTIAIACTLALWGLAVLLKKQKVENKNEFQLSSAREMASPISQAAFPISVFKNVRGFAISLLIWLVLVEAGVELWYRHLESQLKPGPRWSVNFPQDNATLKELPIPADTRYLLRFDEGRQAAWTESDGTQWQVFYCSWLPGRVAGYLAKRHTPEICMQATGVKLVSGPELTMMNVHGVELPVRSYVFETAGGPINVFHCRWEAGADESAYVQHESARFNLVRGIWTGRGNKGQKVLEVIITGMDDPAQARAALVRQLEKLITVSAVGAPNSDSAR
jgi:exosortase